MENKKILTGVSGGVDSSVCVDLLKKQGFEVYGAVINFNDHSDSAIEDAHKVCTHLDIPICVIDARDNFEKNVVEPFCKSYISGRTPNPCVVCNPLVKLKSLCDKADEMGIFYVATGHYAQIVEENGFTVWMAPKSILAGSDYATEIPKAIKGCSVFLLILFFVYIYLCSTRRKFDKLHSSSPN